MVVEPTTSASPGLGTLGLQREVRRVTIWGRYAKNRLALLAFIVLAALALMSITAPLWEPYNHVLDQTRTATFSPPSFSHWFGLDEYGRDVFARAVWGGRLSLWIAFSSALLSTVLGTIFGMLAGYFGGWIDAIIDRLIELILTIPFLLLLILAAAVARPSPTSIILILGLFDWPVLARLVRGEFLALKRRDYIEAARSVGVAPTRIVIRHILPNAMAPIIVTGTLIVAIHLTSEAAISFLGLGIQPPTPSWGNLLTNAQNYVIASPFLAIFPGLLILITVLCVNLLGDGLRDAMDPRQRA
ncbi:MAG TPA: ABC transporter permease [Thermomicrobiaceae bacterium]|nr:ABC transporter permease [Thermomicrobiaceae bacterium]